MDNVAEGFGRGGNLEFRNFLGFSPGSCTELKTQLYRAKDKYLIIEEEFQKLSQKWEKEIAKIASFINFLIGLTLKAQNY